MSGEWIFMMGAALGAFLAAVVIYAHTLLPTKSGIGRVVRRDGDIVLECTTVDGVRDIAFKDPREAKETGLRMAYLANEELRERGL